MRDWVDLERETAEALVREGVSDDLARESASLAVAGWWNNFEPPTDDEAKVVLQDAREWAERERGL